MTQALAVPAAGSSPQLGALGRRYGKVDDHNYVVKSWVNANGHVQQSRDCGRVYRMEHTGVVLDLLKRHSTVLRVAHLEDDEDAIIAWTVYEATVLHYVYVRAEERRKGLARWLLSEFLAGAPDDAIFTHKPSTTGLRVPSLWTYNPYRALR